MRLLHSLGAFVLCALLGCRTPQAASTPDAAKGPTSSSPVRITLIGTNDTHGYVFARTSKLPSGPELSEGGPAILAGYLAILRADNPGGVLLLDAGDLFQGTLVSNVTEGEVVIDVYNALGYRASAIGNHEFDYGPVGPVSVAQPGTDPFGSLKARMQQANFPLLAVNIYDAKTGQRPPWLGNDGTLMVEVKGIKVGILGLITPSTPFTTNPVNVQTLRFGSLAPEAMAAAKKLRDRGADVVVAIAHAGGRCPQLEDRHDLKGCDQQSSEIFEMLDQMPPGALDAVIAGHTHAQLGHYVHDTPVIETPGQERYFGYIDLFVDPRSHHVLRDQTRLHAMVPICEKVDAATHDCEAKHIKEKSPELVPAEFLGHRVVPDESLEHLIKPALAKVEAEQHRKLGVQLPETLRRNYEAESALGDVLSDALRASESADVALLNPGGLRADLPAGELTYGDVYEVLPFDNTVANVSITGEELKRLLVAAYDGRKGMFQVSGLEVQLSHCPGQGRLRNVTTLDGKPLLPERKYKLAMPDFLARGGDGLGPVMSSLPQGRVDMGLTRQLNFRDAVVARLQKASHSLVAPKPGRIHYVDAPGGCEGGSMGSGH